MWVVYDFDALAEEFRPIGCYTNEQDALAHRDRERSAKGANASLPVHCERTFEDMVAEIVRSRLGALANIIATNGLLPQPAEIWFLEKKGELLGVFLSEAEGRRAQDRVRIETVGAIDCYSRLISKSVGIFDAKEGSFEAQSEKEIKMLYGRCSFPVAEIIIEKPGNA